jgi:hypothetical protein
VKLAEFNALCEREWEKQKGDVQSLYLTQESAEELGTDVLLNPDGPHVSGFQIGKLCNPITKSAVEIRPGAPRDRAGAWYAIDMGIDHP